MVFDGVGEDLVILGRALGCGSRVRLLQLLGDEGMSVSAAVAEMDLAQGTVSYHLGILLDAGLVERVWCGAGYRYRWPRRRLYIAFTSDGSPPTGPR